MPINTYFKNRLPHIAPIGATFFVTFNLEGAIPKKVIHSLKLKYNQWLLNNRNQESDISLRKREHFRNKKFIKFDAILDKIKQGKPYLKNEQIAQLLVDKLTELDNKLYRLHAYCIMPNHVHLLIDLSIQLYDEGGFLRHNYKENYIQLPQIIKNIKGSTARKANIILNRNGAFWQKDYYDRYIRNNRGFWNVINYILNNPVKAGFVKKWEDYPYNYLNEDLLYTD